MSVVVELASMIEIFASLMAVEVERLVLCVVVTTSDCDMCLFDYTN